MTKLINVPKPYRTIKLLAGLALVYGLGFTVLIPLGGESTSLSPISTTWAGPNCDADGDGVEKNHPKCEGGDRDDSDPCVPDDEAAACDSGGGGGGGGGGDLGSAISMICTLNGVSGDTSGETIKGDGQGILGDYEDAVDKVGCSIEGPSTPWPIRLVIGDKGRPQNSVRKVDVVLGDFVLSNGSRSAGTDYLKTRYSTLFSEASAQVDLMEPIRVNVRPYRNDDNQTGYDGIHLLPWSEDPYKMGLRFSFPGTERFSISVASQHYPGNESFTGIGCDTLDDSEDAILANSPSGAMKDASVYLWQDKDLDGYPDAYTVSTGTIVVDENGDASVPVAGSKWGAVCSSVGPLTCGNPKAPSNCNFLGYVSVQFTMHTIVK